MAADEKPNAGGRWRPLDWLQVAAAEKRMLADTGGHWSGCKWPRKMWKRFRGRMSGGHLRPLAATRVAARGCKLLPVTRERWRPLAATRVAASGCHFQNQITRLLRAQWEF